MIIQNTEKGNANCNKVYLEIPKDTLVRMGASLRQPVPRSYHCVMSVDTVVCVCVSVCVILLHLHIGHGIYNSQTSSQLNVVCCLEIHVTDKLRQTGLKGFMIRRNEWT